MMGQRWIRSGFWLFAGAHLVLWTAIPLMIQPNPPLDAVEIVAWGHEWRLGYPKHPPLAPWLAEAARALGGNHALWPIYVLGQLCVVIAFWAVWRLGRELTTPAIAFASVLMLEATGRYTWMTLELNHSLVVLPFFPLTALCLYRALTTGRFRWWLATGGALGLGMMAKYVIGLLGLAIVIALFRNRDTVNVDEMSNSRYLPEGLVEGCKLKRDIAKDAVLTYQDVELPRGRLADQLRAQQCRHFRGETWLEEIVGAPALAGDRK